MNDTTFKKIDESKIEETKEKIKSGLDTVKEKVTNNAGDIVKTLFAGASLFTGGLGILAAATGAGLILFISLGSLMGTGALMTLLIITVSSAALVAIGGAMQGE